MSSWAWQSWPHPDHQPSALLPWNSTANHPEQGLSLLPVSSPRKKNNNLCHLTSCLCRNQDNLVNGHLLTPDLLGSPSENHHMQSCLLSFPSLSPVIPQMKMCGGTLLGHRLKRARLPPWSRQGLPCATGSSPHSTALHFLVMGHCLDTFQTAP